MEAHKKALLAQLAERSLSKRKVGGSIPPGGSLFIHRHTFIVKLSNKLLIKPIFDKSICSGLQSKQNAFFLLF